MAYTLTLKVAEQGAKLSNGKIPYSMAGHVWYSISDGTNTYSYGYTSKGVVYTDNNLYLETYYTGEIAITEEQFKILKNFGQKNVAKQHGFGDNDYNVMNNSCVDFTWKALNLAGINPKNFQGNLWPYDNSDNLDEALHKFLFGNLDDYDNKCAKNGDCHVIFGSKNDDTLEFKSNTDAIYGGDGNDIMCGNTLNRRLYGNQRLYGGNGDDTYKVGDKDTIIDADHKGKVYFNSKFHLTGGTYDKTKGCYVGGDYEYRLSPLTKTLTVKQISTGQSISIKDYSKKEKSLGIELKEENSTNSQIPTISQNSDKNRKTFANQDPQVAAIVRSMMEKIDNYKKRKNLKNSDKNATEILGKIKDLPKKPNLQIHKFTNSKPIKPRINQNNSTTQNSDISLDEDEKLKP